MAKKIIRLTTAIGETVNNDPDVSDLLKVPAHGCCDVRVVNLVWMFLHRQDGPPMAGRPWSSQAHPALLARLWH